MIYGWDGSSWQGVPDVVTLQAEGHDFCIQKATGEGDYFNPTYFPVRDKCRAAGLVFGSYDWVEPQMWETSVDGVRAAEDYLRAIGERLPGELLCVDFETPEWNTGPMGSNIEEFMAEYLYALRDLSGQPVIVYTAPYFLRETGAVHWGWLGQDFTYWMAAPGPQAMLPDSAPWPGPLTPPWTTVQIHQHQWHATSPAVRGEFDRNRFRGTVGDLQLLGLPGPGTGTDQEGDVQEPPEGKYTAYINEQGNPIFVWNMGGQTPRILGINVQDLGMTVESATEPGVPLDRSIQDQEVQPYHDRRQD